MAAVATRNNLDADCAAGYTAFRRNAKFDAHYQRHMGGYTLRSLMATLPTLYGNTLKLRPISAVQRRAAFSLHN